MNRHRNIDRDRDIETGTVKDKQEHRTGRGTGTEGNKQGQE